MTRPMTAAIIVAAGSSTRMGLGFSKQLIPLCGKPAVWHTLSAFQRSSVIDEIVVVAREDDKETIAGIAAGFSKVKAVVNGGSDRADSVFAGVKACSAEAACFAIHDGARILITEEEIGKVVNAAYSAKAATLGTPVTDTVKIVGNHNVIKATPYRSTLFAVQTPQVFERDLYERAMKHAKESGLHVTDDCAMVEALGEPVTVVLGKYSNIKLTTPTDVVLAEALLKNR